MADPQQNGPQVYGTTQAAEYLGISLELLKHYLYDLDPAPLQPDQRIGQQLIFSQATLDRFAAWHRPPGLTVAEAAEYLGVSRGWVAHHLYVTKRLRPDGRRGKAHIFKTSTLDALRQSLAKTSSTGGRPRKKIAE